MQKSTLRPGLIVVMKTNITGNVSYRVEELEPATQDENGIVRAKWETERTTLDAEEHALAIKVRTRCRGRILKVTSWSSFGLLCPEVNEDKLSDAVQQSMQEVQEFNDTATVTRLGFYVLCGRVAADDLEAVRAISAEVRELLAEMERGIAKLDPAAIRTAAAKVRSLGSMLSDEAAARVQGAIDVAREAAKKIVAAGQGAAIEVDKLAIEAITAARTSFLDLDVAAEIATPTTVGRGIDLGPVTPEYVDELFDQLVPAGREIDL